MGFDRQQGGKGLVGLHLEGPHLSVARKGAHDPTLIRPMEDRDLDLMLSCGRALDVLMVTIAPESVTQEQVTQLADAGIIVSLLLVGGYGDIALRDFGLLLGALTLARLASANFGNRS